MAAPAEQTTLDLSGRFMMNKSQSDSTEEILTAQGVGWLTRKAILYGTLTLDINHYKDDTGVEHIDINQTVSGIAGTTELRELNWKEHEHQDHIFGAVVGKSKRIPLAEIEEEFLKTGWTADVTQYDAVLSYVQSDTPKSGKKWIAQQVWGFEVIEGERKYVRHVHFVGGGKNIEAKLVYDYLGARA